MWACKEKVWIWLHYKCNQEKETRPHACFYINLLHVIIFPFFPQSHFRNSIFSLLDFDLFPWSERKGWSLRFANFFLIIDSGGQGKRMQRYFIVLHLISNSKEQKRKKVFSYICIYKLKVGLVFQQPPATHFPIWSMTLQCANHPEITPKIQRLVLSIENTIC